eukprot:scaffold41637_cov82-Cyclotella_meneghiniana.AAC.8
MRRKIMRESCHENARRSQEGPTPGNVHQPDYNNRRLTFTNSSGRKRQAATSAKTYWMKFIRVLFFSRSVLTLAN